MIRFRALGSLELTGPDGETTDSVLSQPKRTALLAYLALATPRGFHRRDKIVGVFWPDSAHEQARASLRRSIHFLRLRLGEEVVIGRGDEELSLDWGQVWCDAVAFEDAVEAGRTEAALELYQGDLLEGFFLSRCPEFERWLEGERERLKEKAAGAAWSLAHQRIREGRLTEAERTGQRALSLVPTDENEVRRFIGALAEGGDRAAAIRFYEKFAALLATHLNVTPSRETALVAEAIRAEDASETFTRTLSSTAARETVAERDRESDVPVPGAGVKTEKSWGWLRRFSYLGPGVAILAAIFIMSFPSGERPPDPAVGPVAVVPFANETGDSAYGRYGKMIANWITGDLGRQGIAPVVPWEEVNSLWEGALARRDLDPLYDPRRAIAADLDAEMIVGGSYYLVSDTLVFQAEITGAAGSESVMHVGPVRVSSDDIRHGIETLGEKVVSALAFLLDPTWAERARYMVPMPSLSAYWDYTRYLEVAWSGNWAESVGLLERVLRQDSTYLPAKLGLAAAYFNLGARHEADSLLRATGPLYEQLGPVQQGQWIWIRANLDGERETAYALAKDQLRRTPSALGLYVLGFEALRVNRPGEALEALSTLDPSTPPVKWSQNYWAFLTLAWHTLGDHHRELLEAQRGRALHPDGSGSLLAEIRAHAALGNLRNVSDLLDAAISRNDRPPQLFRVAAGELREHGHLDASRTVAEKALGYLQSRPPRIAQTEAHRFDLLRAHYMLGNLDEARSIAMELAREAPSDPEYLGHLGALAARAGETEEARRISRRLAGLDQPFLSGSNTRWRARIEALLGNKGEAVSLLRQAHKEGMRLLVSIRRDMDLESLRGYPAFEELMRPKG